MSITNEIFSVLNRWDLPEYYKLLDEFCDPNTSRDHDDIHILFSCLANFSEDHMIFGIEKISAKFKIDNDYLSSFIRNICMNGNINNLSRISQLYKFDEHNLAAAIYETLKHI